MLRAVQVERRPLDQVDQTVAAQDLLLHLREALLDLHADHIGHQPLEMVCGVIRMTAVETKVSCHMKATTTATTRPPNIGPISHERYRRSMSI